jgi:16S rRNA (guanine527-N7)-methyltransferase
MLSPDSMIDDLTYLSLDRAAAQRIAPAMTRYVEELHRGNDRFGLIGRDDAADPQRLVSRHILDSIAPWPIVAELMVKSGRTRLYDLGSGAGLPGIPLAYALSQQPAVGLEEAVLVERRSKRVAFLLGVLPGLRRAYGDSGSPRIRALELDTGQLPSHERELLGSAVVVFRAYQQTNEDLLGELSRVFGPGTPVCAFKGKSEHARIELELLRESSHAEEGSVHVVSVPSDVAERSVLTWYTADNRRPV